MNRQMKIVITNKEIVYDWVNDKRNPYIQTITRFRKKGYITEDLAGREIGITFKADDKRKDKIYGNAYMLFFQEYKSELGQWRLVKTTYGEPFSYIKLQEILNTQDKYDNLHINIENY